MTTLAEPDNGNYVQSPRIWFGLRARLLLVVGAAVVPALLLLMSEGEKRRTEALESAGQQAIALARLGATEQGNLIRSTRHTLSVLAELPALHQKGATTCGTQTRTLLDNMVKNLPVYISLTASDLEGRVFCQAGPASALPLPIVDAGFQSSGSAIGEYFNNDRESLDLLPLSLLVRDRDGTPVTVLTAGLDLNWMSRSMQDRLPPGALYNLIDETGRVLVRSSDPERWIGRRAVGSALLQAAEDAVDGAIVQANGLDGTARVFGLLRFEIDGRTLFSTVGFAQDQVVAAAERYRSSALGAVAAGLVLALLAAALLGQRLILGPLKAVTLATRQLASGDFGTRVATTGAGEIGLLGSAFNRLADSLQQQRAANDAAQRALESEIDHARELSETLRRSNELQDAIVDASPLAIVCLDPERRVLLWSRAAERIFGYGSDELDGRPCPLGQMAEGEDFEALLDRVAAGEAVSDTILSRTRKDGSSLDVSFAGAPLYNDDGRLRAILCLFEDISSRVAMEAQLRHTQKMDAIGNLTGGLAHDFNNLLSIIIGNLDLLEEEIREQPTLLDLCTSASGAALRGAELTRQLLAFARRQPLQPRLIDVNELVTRMTRMMQRLLGEAVEIRLAAGDGLWPVVADPAQLETALANLSNNARDAMPRGGTLRISTKNVHLDEDYAAARLDVLPGPYVVIEVTDTGTGIAAEDLSKIFEPFYTTKPDGKGTGLGLSMVFGFVKQSGGHVGVYSEPGLGTTFRLYLPRAQDGAVVESEDESEVEPTAPGEARILVVEDNPDVRAVVVRQLQGLEYAILEAGSGAEAMELLRSGERVDLLFTDVVMPGGMSGRELAEAAVELRPALRVLFTSGFPAPTLEQSTALSAGDQLISKPYRKRELARKIREVLEAGAMEERK